MDYRKSFAKEHVNWKFRQAGLSFERAFTMPVYYLFIQVGKRHADFLNDNKRSGALKTILQPEPVHFDRARNYPPAHKPGSRAAYQLQRYSLPFKEYIIPPCKGRM